MIPRFIVIHTAAYRGPADIKEIDYWHKLRHFKRRGTHDLQHIGYHWYIRRNGQVQKGREETEIGAHCLTKGMNTRSIGICFEGHGDYQDFTQEQYRSLAMLYEAIEWRWRIDVTHVIGHRETGANKTCPGKQVDMNELRVFLDGFPKRLI